MRNCILRIACCLAISVLIACDGDGQESLSGKMTIAVIPKGTTHEFWKSVHAGAVKAARELDIELARVVQDKSSLLIELYLVYSLCRLFS